MGVISLSFYLALGDSLSTGYGLNPHSSFPLLLYKKLQVLYPHLIYKNLAVNGYTTADLARLLNQPELFWLVSNSRFHTITIGSNDLLNLIRFPGLSGQKVVNNFTNKSLWPLLNGRSLRFFLKFTCFDS